MGKSENPEQLGEKETTQRMNDALQRALNTPPKPHKDFTGKGGKSPKQSAPKARNFRHQGR